MDLCEFCRSVDFSDCILSVCPFFGVGKPRFKFQMWEVIEGSPVVAGDNGGDYGGKFWSEVFIKCVCLDAMLLFYYFASLLL
jgi:hypothetical protein